MRGVTTVTVTGENFLDPGNRITDIKFGGASYVALNGSLAGVNITDDNTLTVTTLPTNAVTGPIVITSANCGDGPGSKNSFTSRWR